MIILVVHTIVNLFTLSYLCKLFFLSLSKFCFQAFLFATGSNAVLSHGGTQTRGTQTRGTQTRGTQTRGTQTRRAETTVRSSIDHCLVAVTVICSPCDRL